MRLNIFIKEPQKDFMDEIVEKYTISDCSKAIHTLIKFASNNQHTNDDFFDIRCVGECSNPDTPISLEISNGEVNYLKQMIEQYNINEYETEQENLGKAVRCLINYVDQEGDPKHVFAQ